MSLIVEGAKSALVSYGADKERIKMVLNDNGNIKTKIYMNGNYEKETVGSQTRELHYISAPTGVFAVCEKTETTTKLYYIHKDHLGSVDVLTNEAGNVVEEQSFDAWGRRRNPSDWSHQNVAATHIIDRGFTGHEHLDQFGVINMNGRLYDPLVGRFLGPDIMVQAPAYTQSYNRYSYCFNNPLKYTDPTGWESKDEDPQYRNPAYTGDIGQVDIFGRPTRDPFSGMYIPAYAQEGGPLAEGYGGIGGGYYETNVTSWLSSTTVTINGDKYTTFHITDVYSRTWVPYDDSVRPSSVNPSSGGGNFSLASLYTHFQVGRGEAMTFKMSSVNFGGATQRDLGLTGMQVGKSRAVNLFNAGPLNQAALAFGNVNMKYHGNNQFSIVADDNSRFDFWPLVGGSSLARDAGNLLGAAINYNLIISPAAMLIPLRFGGPFDVNFIGTTTIPK